MTRNNQTLRAWISRESPKHCFLSHVTCKCTATDQSRTSTLRTPTRIRKAALEFNRSHTLLILTAKPGTPTETETQHELNFEAKPLPETESDPLPP